MQAGFACGCAAGPSFTPTGNPLMRSLKLALLPLATACTTLSGPPAEVTEIGVDGPPPEWIDVPLSPATWWEQGEGYQAGEYAIPVAAGAALEHKISMNEGAMIVYSWTVDMAEPDLLGVEFHGHTERVGAAPGTVMFYKIHADGRESGSLRAPFTGIHGWYLNNASAQDIVVRLKVAGFYTE
jgi:hypothetical protein